MPDKRQPLIVGFVANLIFTSKIENVARHLGYDIGWIDNFDQIR